MEPTVFRNLGATATPRIDDEDNAAAEKSASQDSIAHFTPS